MGFMVLEGYGLTETSPVLCSNTLQRQVAGSVGKPLPGVQLKIENKEIMVRGDNVFQAITGMNRQAVEHLQRMAGSGPATWVRSELTAGWLSKGVKKS